MPLDDARRRWRAAAIPGLGHKGGPPLDDPLPRGDWNTYCWRRAHQRAWKTPPREIALRRLRHAEALGMTYREYQAIIIDRGVYVQERPADTEKAWSATMRRRMKRC